MSPKLIIHGGLGSKPKTADRQDKIRDALNKIAADSYIFLKNHTVLEAVVYAVSLLEDNPLFNAGTGSKIQSDGVIRMTASVMDGHLQRFAGVINIRDVKNPVQVAEKLLAEEDRVLSGEEATKFARGHGFPAYEAETPARRKAFDEMKKGKTGTVGAVALDANGRLAAATSTGGKGLEIPGRVSDSATVAGNYANRHVAVSCTGIGEDIVNSAIAASIATRVLDGMKLEDACRRAIDNVHTLQGHAGLIAIDSQGNMLHAETDPYLAYMMYDEKGVTVF